MTYIEIEDRPPVGRIRLANPPRNVIEMSMMREIPQAVTDFDARPDITAIIFEGQSGNFSAGVDIKAHVPEQVREMLTSFHAAIRAVIGSRKVTIARVEGACLGGGAELATVCDMVYTARDARWAFPEIKLACFPPVAAVVLPALVGQKRASELILTGRQISGDEAVAIGLANQSARVEELERLVQRTIDELSQHSPAALTYAKKSMYAWDAIHFDKGLARAEKIYLEELVSTADAREGIMAFLEKRAAKWTGK
ncbi:MAG: enoyl-CoA hydratase/isomerase family protein [Terriglobales bacterium]